MKYFYKNQLFYLLFITLLLESNRGRAQISLVREFSPSSRVGIFEVLGNKIVFNAEGGLWISDGTNAGTIRLVSSAEFDPYNPYNRCRIGNLIYYWANNAPGDLWKTDGTAAGTQLVKSLGFSPAGPLVNVNGLLIFGFSTAEHGTELWRSDGTDAGTYMITDLVPGSGSGYLYPSTQSSVAGGFFYFQGPAIYTGDPAFGHRPTLYQTDGTAAGTKLVGSSGFEPAAMNVTAGRLVYQAKYLIPETVGAPCYPEPTTVNRFPTVLMVVEDGAARPLQYPVAVPFCGKYPFWGDTFLNSSKFVHSGNYLYFLGQTETVNGATAFNLWRTNGLPGGTIPLTTFASGSNENASGSMFNRWNAWEFGFGTVSYFSIFTSDAGAELWRSDGTPGGTFRLKDINPGPNGSGPLDFRVVGNTAYFFANDGVNGVELWKTDGTVEGTQLVQDLNSGPGGQPIAAASEHFSNAFSISVGNTYYFSGNNGSQRGLFKTMAPPRTMITQRSGNWNDPSIWLQGLIPTSADNVTIETGHVITLTANADAHTVKINGRLVYTPGTKLSLSN